MKQILLALVTTFALVAPTQASILDTQTRPTAQAVTLFGTFHDAQTNFVFVRLPSGWAFVAEDAASSRHPVFFDTTTGFVFVKLSGGWKFVRSIA